MTIPAGPAPPSARFTTAHKYARRCGDRIITAMPVASRSTTCLTVDQAAWRDSVVGRSRNPAIARS